MPIFDDTIDENLVKELSYIFLVEYGDWNPLENREQILTILEDLLKTYDCELLYDDGYFFIYEFTDSGKNLLTYSDSLERAVVKSAIEKYLEK